VLVIAIDPPVTSGGLELRAADLQNAAFRDPHLSFEYAAWGILGGATPLRAGRRSPVSFVAKTVPVGVYVATFAFYNDSNGISFIRAYRCTSEQAAVIEVRPGQLNVVRSNEIYPPGGMLGRLSPGVSDALVLAELARVRADHPELALDPVLLRPIATVSWVPRRRGSDSSDCENTERLRVLRRLIPSATP
jgi:hypothetical protein